MENSTTASMIKWWTEQSPNKRLISAMAITILFLVSVIIKTGSSFSSLQERFRMVQVDCEKAASKAILSQRNIDDSIRREDLRLQHLEDIRICEESKRELYLPRKTANEQKTETIKKALK